MESSAKRFVALDGLRGLAAVLVLLFHLRWHGDHTVWAGHLALFPFVSGGYLAVDLFFILSGFVLASSYLERLGTAAQAGTFFRMRFFRIYPLHLFALLVMIGIELVKLAGKLSGRTPSTHMPFSSPDTLGDIGLNALLIQSLGITDHESWNAPSWSISCEAAGYVCFAAAAFGNVFKSRVFKLLAVPIALISYGMLLAYKGTLDLTYDLGIVRCLAGMMLGVWIYELSRSPLIARTSDPVVGALSSIAVMCVVLALCFSDGSSQILAIPAFALTILFLQRDRGLAAAALGSPPMRFLGRISYSTYLMHFPLLSVLGLLMAYLNKGFLHSATLATGSDARVTPADLWIGDIYVALAVLLVIFVASITYQRIELPWQNFARRNRTTPRAASVADSRAVS